MILKMDSKSLILWVRERLRRNILLFWLYQLYIKKRREYYLHPRHLAWGKNHASPSSKPILPYIEMHLTTHCNIKCKGCSQFSPIADKWYADINEHERDMKQLSTLYSNIETIRLVGGEPLLHTEIDKFLYITREYFKKSNICIATNGALFYSMTDSFWEACKKNHIKINWTMYPPFSHMKNEIMAKVESKGVIISYKKVDKFRAILNLKGDSNPESAFKFCRSLYFAPFLRSGKIYLCSRPVVIDTFNEKFGTKIPAGGYADIHAAGVTGWDVLISISKSTEICRYCATKQSEFDWTDTKFEGEEWNALNN